VAALCVPYLPQGTSPETLIPLVDRNVYPADKYPAGQWDYQLHYRESFDEAVAELDANPVNTVKAMFRAGNPAHVGKPAPNASLRRRGGWFGEARTAPDLPLDTRVLSEASLQEYAGALGRNGFRGPCSWYMNGPANDAYMRASANGGRLSMPALMIHAEYDTVCETLQSPLAQPMRAHCDRLSEATVKSGHWMAQEQPEAVNSALARWLAAQLPQAWR
jgi:pimeloyl-ACP methyl ester carboxylesterase